MSERVCSTGVWVLLRDLEGRQEGEFSQLLWEARLPSIHPDCCAFTLGLELSRALAQAPPGPGGMVADLGLCLLLFCLPLFLLHVVTTVTARHGDTERKSAPQAACILWERKNRPGSNTVCSRFPHFPPPSYHVTSHPLV